ncbi:unnamed protein product [Cylicocyclus nassatus]|uniref:Uncharacterized protein n=1 Tax=Cylicocyclus nassatus TaxID=53992 RepID=A0AA36M8H8_CYLNA|nr:unnamed protein product [Cylicocyclus nassatus]
MEIFTDNFFIQTTITTALLTFVLKMFTASLLRTSKASLITRGVFGVLTISFATSILDNANSFKVAVVCDQMVSPAVALCEYAFLLILLTNYALDIFDSHSIRLCVACSQEEVMDYLKMEMERKCNSFSTEKSHIDH